VRAFLLAVMLTCSALSRAADLSHPLILVAKPELRDNAYSATILVVRSLGGDAHVGFIVNRPAGVSLGEVFPGHDHAQKLVDPVYSGGPFAQEAIFALVQRPDAPGGKSVQILPGLFAVVDEATLDRIVETGPDRARLVTGLVASRPGELASEALWEELVHRSRGARLGI
jgi:putative AlgH/UPF0301 family transcriptional regulator